MHKPYSIEARKPVLRMSVVMVVDILGFKTLSRSGGDSEFLRLYRAIARAEAKLRQFVPGAYVLKTYTDNIVVCWPWDHRDDSELPLGITMRQAAAFQLSLTLSGYCARGAIAVGRAFANHQTVFGPALIEAHESEISANYPRIILAPSAVHHAAKHATYYRPMKTAPQNEDLLVDLRDRCVFLDYLTCGLGLCERPQTPRVLSLWQRDMERHRSFVTDNLRRHAQKVRAKYQWLAQYHNHVVRHRAQPDSRIPRYSAPNRFATFLELVQHLNRGRPDGSARRPPDGRRGRRLTRV